MRTQKMFNLFCVAASAFCYGHLANAGTIRVVDENSGHGLVSDIYHVDVDSNKHRAGRSDANGICHLPDNGKQGEKYVAVTEEYNPGSTECPLKEATVKLHRTTLLAEYKAKGDFLASAGELGAAALEFRKASLAAKKENNTSLADKFEFTTAVLAAKNLNVSKPFENRVTGRPTYSNEFESKIRDFQKSKDLKPTGELTSETLSVMKQVDF